MKNGENNKRIFGHFPEKRRSRHLTNEKWRRVDSRVNFLSRLAVNNLQRSLRPCCSSASAINSWPEWPRGFVRWRHRFLPLQLPRPVIYDSRAVADDFLTRAGTFLISALCFRDVYYAARHRYARRRFLLQMSPRVTSIF